MKLHHEEHIGMYVILLDETKGKVVKVSEKGYTIKTDEEKFVLKLEDIRWAKSGKLIQIGERDLSGQLRVLRNCGHKSDGVLVKIYDKTKTGEYDFAYTTGCGGRAPTRCFGPITKETGLNIEGDKVICDACRKAFKHKDLHLYYVPLKDHNKHGVVCSDCQKLMLPLLNKIKTEPPVPGKIARVGHEAIKSFDKKTLLNLNNTVVESLKDISEMFVIDYSELHRQIRPTAMEYVIRFKLKSDVEPKLKGGVR